MDGQGGKGREGREGREGGGGFKGAALVLVYPAAPPTLGEI